MKLVYRALFVLTLSILMSSIAFAQVETTQATSAFTTPKLVVFGITVVISIITDSIVIGFLSGGIRPIRAIVSSLPFSFLNVFWYDVVAPAMPNTPILAMKFMAIGNPAWNYFIGMNVIAVFVGNLIWQQVIFRFARGAADASWTTDIIMAALDAALPAVLYLTLPTLGVI